MVTVQSFLQDFVVTPDQGWAVIADMGQADLPAKADPALVTLNLVTGEATRKLSGHPSVRPTDKAMQAGGAPVMAMANGREVSLFLGLNPITLDPSGTWVYFGPMSQGLLYRVKTSDLVNNALTADQLADRSTPSFRVGFPLPSTSACSRPLTYISVVPKNGSKREIRFLRWHMPHTQNASSGAYQFTHRHQPLFGSTNLQNLNPPTCHLQSKLL